MTDARDLSLSLVVKKSKPKPRILHLFAFLGPLLGSFDSTSIPVEVEDFINKVSVSLDSHHRSPAMAEPMDFEDWEFLDSSEAAIFPCPQLSKLPVEIESQPHGIEGIKADYFTLKSAKGAAFVEAGENVGFTVDDNDSRVNPNRPKGELGFEGAEFAGVVDESNPLHDSENGEPDSQNYMLGTEKVEFSTGKDEGIEAGDRNSDEIVSMKEAGTEFAGVIEGIEPRDEKEKELGSDECAKMEDNVGSVEEGARNWNPLPSEGEKRGMIWLKLPLDLIKLCVLRVRPVWSISIAAAVLGIVMLGRRLYKIRHKSRRIPLKVNIDNKKATQFSRATRLNEAFSLVKLMPLSRSPLPARVVGVTPWPAVAFH